MAVCLNNSHGVVVDREREIGVTRDGNQAESIAIENVSFVLVRSQIMSG